MCSFMALILFSKVVNDIVIVNQSIITSLHNDVELWENLLLKLNQQNGSVTLFINGGSINTDILKN